MDYFDGEAVVLAGDSIVCRGMAHLELENRAGGWTGVVDSPTGFERGRPFPLALMRLRLIASGRETTVIGYPYHGSSHRLRIMSAPGSQALWQ